MDHCTVPAGGCLWLAVLRLTPLTPTSNENNTSEGQGPHRTHVTLGFFFPPLFYSVVRHCITPRRIGQGARIA